MHGAPTAERPLRVAIACDSRHQSQEFAQITAEVLAASGLEPWLYPELRPTPQLSWTVRELGAVAGVVVTASHNPSIYNGYKVYAADGGQVVAPEDAQLVAGSAGVVHGPARGPNLRRHHVLDATWDDRYRDVLASFRLSPDFVANGSELTIAYTGLHGTGALAVPAALKAFGFKNVHEVPSQAIPDGAFPTVHSPNPEEAAAQPEAVAVAKQVGASKLMGTDPESDRVGIALPDGDGVP